MCKCGITTIYQPITNEMLIKVLWLLCLCAFPVKQLLLDVLLDCNLCKDKQGPCKSYDASATGMSRWKSKLPFLSGRYICV